MKSNPSSFEILFFSRGRGRGHAVPDMSIAEYVRARRPETTIRWISYSTGAATFKECGYEVIDLGLPDHNRFLETQIKAVRLLSKYQPNLVISHEEYAAVPAACIAGVPSLFITDYFVSEEDLWMDALRYAREVIFIDDPGFFSVPSYLQKKIWYTGKFVRSFAHCAADRQRVRAHLQLDDDEIFIIVFSGNRPEDEAPIAAAVVSAFKSLNVSKKRLGWIAGRDASKIRDLVRSVDKVTVLDFKRDLDQWMCACDLAITKGTRKLALELESFAVPSISISHGINRIDDERLHHIRGNVSIDGRKLRQGELAATIKMLLRRRSSLPEQVVGSSGLESAGERIIQHIDALVSSSSLSDKVSAVGGD
jgi:UDP-N-acetylglucosamine:LPS N-acetylglucosamine transferase